MYAYHTHHTYYLYRCILCVDEWYVWMCSSQLVWPGGESGRSLSMGTSITNANASNTPTDTNTNASTNANANTETTLYCTAQYHMVQDGFSIALHYAASAQIVDSS